MPKRRKSEELVSKENHGKNNLVLYNVKNIKEGNAFKKYNNSCLNMKVQDPLVQTHFVVIHQDFAKKKNICRILF